MTFFTTREDILRVLHRIDDLLTAPQEIELCGTACLLVQGYGFRRTVDIDISEWQSSEIVHISGNFGPSIDFGAHGVISYLEDYKDRLVSINDNFRMLTVKALSLRDWAVSKLSSPKLADLWEQDLVTIELLNWVRANMYLYCGINSKQAILDLEHALGRLASCPDACALYNPTTKSCSMGYTFGQGKCEEGK
jgi:hypothetical protein